MATILRNPVSASAVQKTRESLEEAERMVESARRCWEQTQAEAAALIEQARVEAQQIRSAAVEEGRRQGRAEAEQEVRAEFGRHWAESPAVLESLVTELNVARRAWIARWEHDAVQLALTMAARIVRRESVAEPRLTCGLVREALELASGRQLVRLLLHPRDLSLVGEEVRRIIVSLGRQDAVQVQADESIELGGCRVVTELGEIDQQWSTQLARIAEEIAPA